MTYFCPSCLNEIQSQAEICPICGYDLKKWDDLHFDEKLIQALHHPEPFTRRRAAYLLGERRTASAFLPLWDAFQSASDPYLKAEILRALLMINQRNILELFNKEQIKEESIIVQRVFTDFKV